MLASSTGPSQSGIESSIGWLLGFFRAPEAPNLGSPGTKLDFKRQPPIPSLGFFLINLSLDLKTFRQMHVFATKNPELNFDASVTNKTFFLLLLVRPVIVLNDLSVHQFSSTA